MLPKLRQILKSADGKSFKIEEFQIHAKLPEYVAKEELYSVKFYKC